ncbi:response regulator [Erythrobacter sp. HKB08]|uniref:response regulator n=1 Tax=Erythrobacter sp. HKB08 TaxID=2502843 RepID=UPI001008D36D|nr:response regulator [Erythrobacter sp. HKB08]
MPRNRKIGSVLIVEDDTVLALDAQDALTGAGAKQVDIVTTTEDALVHLRSAKPDAILLDVYLADRDDGWAIAELVHEVGPRPPKIVFSTGAPADIPPEIAKLGTLLEKPYSHEQLINAVCGSAPKGLLASLRR